MISRREKLLIRPWQQRKYEIHRRKIHSVRPVVDNHPPPSRAHIEIKLKHLQRENERHEKIEKENLLLLKKLNIIMKTSHVDNRWNTPQPNFINRVAMYDTYKKVEKDPVPDVEIPQQSAEKSTRKSRCSACIRKTTTEMPKILDDPTPWRAKDKETVRKRSKSVPACRLSQLPVIEEQSVVKKEPTLLQRTNSVTNKNAKLVNSKSNLDIEKRVKKTAPQSITISRGGLKLAVKFPSDAVVKFKNGHTENFLMNKMCMCKRFAISAL